MGKVKVLRQYGKGGYNKTRGAIYQAIMSGEDFDSGHLWARNTAGGYTVDREITHGRLPLEWKVRFVKDQPDYVVYSYGTPIAWHVPKREKLERDEEFGHQVYIHTPEYWVMPDETYSHTTTRHQGFVRVALSFVTDPVTEL